MFEWNRKTERKSEKCRFDPSAGSTKPEKLEAEQRVKDLSSAKYLFDA